MTLAARITALRRSFPSFGLVQALALVRSRRSLALLDDHMLRDIGLTRDQARTEAERPLWDAAPSWRR